MNKQITLSMFTDELAQAAKKKAVWEWMAVI